jgi:hypothetical protein
MFKAIAHLESVAPYSQSRAHETPKLEKEGHDDYERRTWREKCHYLNEVVFIPPMAFKFGLFSVAQFLGEQIPGRGRSTWTKHFAAGILVLDPAVLGNKKADIQGEWFFVHADGKRGSGTRVRKCFPVVPEWKTAATFHILDRTISRKVFEHHLMEMGKFVGIGRFRPQNQGYYGRFKVNDIEWIEG